MSEYSTFYESSFDVSGVRIDRTAIRITETNCIEIVNLTTQVLGTGEVSWFPFNLYNVEWFQPLLRMRQYFWQAWMDHLCGFSFLYYYSYINYLCQWPLLHQICYLNQLVRINLWIFSGGVGEDGLATVQDDEDVLVEEDVSEDIAMEKLVDCGELVIFQLEHVADINKGSFTDLLKKRQEILLVEDIVRLTWSLTR